jgi:predicted dehydrogenase
MTQSNPLRVGLIGAGGRWGSRAHVPALKGVSEAEIYAVCTAHADIAQAAMGVASLLLTLVQVEVR